MATVAFAFPFLSRAGQGALKARWSRQLLDALGVRLLATGTPPTGGLFVANHISWLDIFAINALAPTAFVSKDDVRRWPVIGWLAANAETIFLERGSRAAAVRAKEHLATELRQRRRIGVFPEGTTSFGAHVMPFHSALFQAAVDTGVHVVPVSLRYTGADGCPCQAAAYVGDTHLGASILDIVRASGLTARVAFLPSLEPGGADRRHLAATAHRAIAHALGHALAACAGNAPAAAEPAASDELGNESAPA